MGRDCSPRRWCFPGPPIGISYVGAWFAYVTTSFRPRKSLSCAFTSAFKASYDAKPEQTLDQYNICYNKDIGITRHTSFSLYSTNAYPRGFPLLGPDLWKRKSSLATLPNLAKTCRKVYLWSASDIFVRIPQISEVPILNKAGSPSSKGFREERVRVI